MPTGNRHDDDKRAERDAADHVRISSRAEAVRFIGQLLEQAQRSILVFAPMLEPAFFSQSDVIERLASFAVAHRRNLARFLVEDATLSVQHNTRLAELSRRLSDFIKFQQVDQDHSSLREMYMVVDERAYLHQPELDKTDYVVAFDERRRARLLTHEFDRMWERSQPITEVHTLGLAQR
jgi:sugar-specific transcriptional regulator TrmB